MTLPSHNLSGLVPDQVPGSETSLSTVGRRRQGSARQSTRVYSSSLEILRDYYGAERIPKPSKLALKDVKASAHIKPEEFEEILKLAQSDLTLDRTLAILMLCFRKELAQVSSSDLATCAKAVLKIHPAFQASEVQRELTSSSASLPSIEVCKMLLGQSYVALLSSGFQPRTVRGAAKRCRQNAFWCFILAVYQPGSISECGLVEHLTATIWAPSGTASKQRVDFKLLQRIRDQAAVGTICRVLESNAQYERIGASAARREAAELLTLCKNLEASLSLSRAELSNALAGITQLRDQLAHEREEQANQQAGMRDSHEQARSRILSKIRQDLELLDDGLKAIQRDPPLVQVMIDHAERVLLSLRTELKRFQEAD